MKRKPADPRDLAPDKSPIALLLIDVINDMSFPSAEKLLRYALPAAKRIAALKSRLRKRGVPCIYVNDNFGRWQSDFKAQVARCMSGDCPGAPVARLLIPAEDDYFVLKPRHSGFFSTSLDVLLGYLGAEELIVTGFAGDICVLYTANDAFMREYRLRAPADCIASETLEANRYACAQMKRFLHADVRPSRFVRVPTVRKK
jgi:nicotinamidase-related amidase